MSGSDAIVSSTGSDSGNEEFGRKMGGSGASLVSENMNYVASSNDQLLRSVRLKRILSLFLQHHMFQRCLLDWRVSTALIKVAYAIRSVRQSSDTLLLLLPCKHPDDCLELLLRRILCMVVGLQLSDRLQTAMSTWLDRVMLHCSRTLFIESPPQADHFWWQARVDRHCELMSASVMLSCAVWMHNL